MQQSASTDHSALHSAVIGDVLDVLGLFDQFMPAAIRPIAADMVLVGRAMPVRIEEVRGPQTKPFGLLTEAIDQLEVGEVYIADGGSAPCAAWGELLTTTALARGSVGAVLDGFHRDTAGILRQGFPVFSRGAWAQDASVRSTVTAYREPISIGAVTIRPGDLIFADRDGVVIVPRDVEDEVLDRARAKAATENVVLKAIRAGLSATDAFARYGVL